MTESSGLISFREQAALPPMDVMNKRYQDGICGFNVDGVCISSGTKVAGSSGYRLAGMGYPVEQALAEGSDCAGCNSFPLWYKNNTAYELGGIMLKTNRKPLVNNGCTNGF
jgi:hypothetical protein